MQHFELTLGKHFSQLVVDASPLVREELVVALSQLIEAQKDEFNSVTQPTQQEEIVTTPTAQNEGHYPPLHPNSSTNNQGVAHSVSHSTSSTSVPPSPSMHGISASPALHGMNAMPRTGSTLGLQQYPSSVNQQQTPLLNRASSDSLSLSTSQNSYVPNSLMSPSPASNQTRSYVSPLSPTVQTNQSNVAQSPFLSPPMSVRSTSISQNTSNASNNNVMSSSYSMSPFQAPSRSLAGSTSLSRIPSAASLSLLSGIPDTLPSQSTLHSQRVLIWRVVRALCHDPFPTVARAALLLRKRVVNRSYLSSNFSQAQATSNQSGHPQPGSLQSSPVLSSMPASTQPDQVVLDGLKEIGYIESGTSKASSGKSFNFNVPPNHNNAPVTNAAPETEVGLLNITSTRPRSRVVSEDCRPNDGNQSISQAQPPLANQQQQPPFPPQQLQIPQQIQVNQTGNEILTVQINPITPAQQPVGILGVLSSNNLQSYLANAQPNATNQNNYPPPSPQQSPRHGPAGSIVAGTPMNKQSISSNGPSRPSSACGYVNPNVPHRGSESEHRAPSDSMSISNPLNVTNSNANGLQALTQQQALLFPNSSIFERSVETFSSPLVESEDPDSVLENLLTLQWRKRRNEEIVSQANSFVASNSSFDSNELGNFDQISSLPSGFDSVSNVLFHPYENLLVCADHKKNIAVFETKEFEKINVFSNDNLKGTRISQLLWINEENVSLLCTGSDDGVVKIWRSPHQASNSSTYNSYNNLNGGPSSFIGAGSPVPSPFGSPDMVSAWMALRGLPRIHNNPYKLALDWQQTTGHLLATGNTDMIRIWDVECEICVLDLPVEGDAPVNSVCSMLEGSVIFTGCGDGVVRIFDLRADVHQVHQLSRHPAPVVGTHVQKYSSIETCKLISGSLKGDIFIHDLRKLGGSTYGKEENRNSFVHFSPSQGLGNQNTSATSNLSASISSSSYPSQPSTPSSGSGNNSGGSSLNNTNPLSNNLSSFPSGPTSSFAGFEKSVSMDALAIHNHAPLIAAGSQKQVVRIADFTGSHVSTLKYHKGFMGHRIGPVSSLAFHPHKLMLAVGSTNPFISVLAVLPPSPAHLLSSSFY